MPDFDLRMRLGASGPRLSLNAAGERKGPSSYKSAHGEDKFAFFLGVSSRHCKAKGGHGELGQGRGNLGKKSSGHGDGSGFSLSMRSQQAKLSLRMSLGGEGQPPSRKGGKSAGGGFSLFLNQHGASAGKGGGNAPGLSLRLGKSGLSLSMGGRPGKGGDKSGGGGLRLSLNTEKAAKGATSFSLGFSAKGMQLHIGQGAQGKSGSRSALTVALNLGGTKGKKK